MHASLGRVVRHARAGKYCVSESNGKRGRCIADRTVQMFSRRDVADPTSLADLPKNSFRSIHRASQPRPSFANGTNEARHGPRRRTECVGRNRQQSVADAGSNEHAALELVSA